MGTRFFFEHRVSFLPARLTRRQSQLISLFLKKHRAIEVKQATCTWTQSHSCLGAICGQKENPSSEAAQHTNNHQAGPI